MDIVLPACVDAGGVYVATQNEGMGEALWLAAFGFYGRFQSDSIRWGIWTTM